MHNTIHSIYKEILSSVVGLNIEELTPYFVIAMLILCVLHFVMKKDFKSTIISIGIFGTFLGILIGLLGFDISDITSSVPMLLKGLKTAFATSVFGMIFSIVLQITEKFLNSANSESSIEDLLDLQIKESQETRETVIIEMRQLIGKLIKITTQNLTTIDKSINRAFEKMSEGATKEIISALQSVIKDFNNNLTEQFGDNFKKLNESILNMIKWQQNYKSSIENIEKSLKETSHLLSQNEEYTNKLTEKFSTISKSNEDLSKVIQINENQIKNLEFHMRHLKEVGQGAGLIVKQIEDFSKNIQDSVSDQSAGLTKLQETLNKELEGSLGKLNECLTSLTNKFRSDYESGLVKIENILKKVG